MNSSKLLEDLFTYTFEKGKTLYRNSTKEYNRSYNNVSWYALHIDDAMSYNKPYTHRVCVKRNLKLINVLHPMFQMDYLQKINEKYPQLSNEKAYACMPIGLPSLKAQISLLTHRPGICHLETSKTSIIDIQNEFYGGKHRYSFKIGEENMDNYFVKELSIFYKDRFDGYIIPHSIVSCFHPEGFHPEICLFAPKNLVSYIDTKATIEKKDGGSRSESNPFDYLRTRETEEIPTIEKLNDETEAYLKRIGWVGPRVYDAYGLLKRPTDKELFRFRAFVIKDNDISPEGLKKILRFRRKEGILTPFHDETYWDTVKYAKNTKPLRG